MALRELRKRARHYQEEQDGVEAFASESDPRPSGDEWRPRTAVAAVAVLCVVLAANLILMRVEPNKKKDAIYPLLPARPALPRLALDGPPVVVPEGVATTGSSPVRPEKAASSIGRPVTAPQYAAAATTVSQPTVVLDNPIADATPLEDLRPLEAQPMPLATESVTVVAHARDRLEADRVLRAYADSYNRMDSRSMAQLWPSVDTAALSRAFNTLSEQHLAFDSCQVDFASMRAIARCAGAVRYVPRVGDPTPRTRRMEWTIELERSDDRWQIARMTVR